MNSVNDIPDSSRVLTDSFCNMSETVKCFPISRRNSISPSEHSQSALLTILAAFEPENSRKRSSWARCLPTFASTSASSSNGRSASLPLGSPINPVPPPTSTMGVPPARCRWARSMTSTRLPIWRLLAVGSNPPYPVIGPLARRSARPGVTSWIMPRQVSSSSKVSIAAKVTKRGNRWQADLVLTTLKDRWYLL